MKDPYFLFTIKDSPVENPVPLAVPVWACNPAQYSYLPFISKYYPSTINDDPIVFSRWFTVDLIDHFFTHLGFPSIGKILLSSYEQWKYNETGPYVDCELVDIKVIQENTSAYKFVTFADLQRKFMESIVFPTLDKFNYHIKQNIHLMDRMKKRYNLAEVQVNDPKMRFEYIKKFLIELLSMYISAGTTEPKPNVVNPDFPVYFVNPDLTLGYEPYEFRLEPEPDWIARASSVRKDQRFTILKTDYQPCYGDHPANENTTILIRLDAKSDVVVGTAIVHRGKIDAIVELENLIVDSRFRNRGYGIELVKYCVDQFGVNTLLVEKSNTLAIRMYAKADFFVVDQCHVRCADYYVMRIVYSI